MTGRTYSLAEVAAMYLPPEWTDGVRWLQRRLESGEISGYKLNRCTWRMTEADVEAFIAGRRNTPAAASQAVEVAPAVSVVDGLSKRSRQSLRSAS